MGFTELDCGGYGGLVDSDGVLWSVDRDRQELLRYGPTDPDDALCASIPDSYGLAVDSAGFIWNSQHNNQRLYNLVRKVYPFGTPGPTYWLDAERSRGVAVSWSGTENYIWVANSQTHDVTKLKNDGTGRVKVNLSTHGGQYPTGVAVDSQGMVWVANRDSDNVMLIDPTTNNVVDTVDLYWVDGQYAHSKGIARPYNYSDMTGVSLLWTTAPAGVWTTVVEGDDPGTVWHKLDWIADVPAAEGNELTVQVRAADHDYDLGKELYVDVEDNVPFTCDVTGKYLQIRVQIEGAANVVPDAFGNSPLLSDLTVYACDMIDCNENDIADYCECPEPILFDVDPAGRGGGRAEAASADGRYPLVRLRDAGRSRYRCDRRVGFLPDHNRSRGGGCGPAGMLGALRDGRK